jgi:hypothetical protein
MSALSNLFSLTFLLHVGHKLNPWAATFRQALIHKTHSCIHEHWIHFLEIIFLMKYLTMKTYCWIVYLTAVNNLHQEKKIWANTLSTHFSTNHSMTGKLTTISTKEKHTAMSVMLLYFLHHHHHQTTPLCLYIKTKETWSQENPHCHKT